MEFGPLRRLSPGESTTSRLASPGSFRPQGFSPSRRFSPRQDLPALFHAGNALGVCPPGGFPRRQVPALVTPRSPHGVAPRSPPKRAPGHSPRALACLAGVVGRLQGLAPSADPYRTAGEVPNRRPIPSWASPLQGFSRHPPGRGKPRSAHALPPLGLRPRFDGEISAEPFADRTRFSVLPDGRGRSPLSSCASPLEVSGLPSPSCYRHELAGRRISSARARTLPHDPMLLWVTSRLPH
jgi:hypothetical protein